MKRLLTCTAVGLFIGLTPALAQSEPPLDESQTPPAIQKPAQPAEQLPVEPSDPAEPIPNEMAPSAAQPDPISPPSLSTEAPRSISPDQPEMTLVDSPQFLTKQDNDDLLASHLIGESVVNANNESIGTISDLVTDADGKVAAVLIRSGSFLGIGGKDVALRFEDIKFSRGEDNTITVMTNISADTLAAAPDYETLEEQKVTVGSASKSDREDSGQ
ncbi:MAG: PRC-barrel domain-containing protein [Methyloceanibacter sp.]|nr:PRC-barrel domain-containing protein [Methyloceanibacter sp.]